MAGRRRKGWNSGAAAVELALVLPVFVTFVFGIFNLGWALYCGAEVRHAVERSTRMLLVDPNTAGADIQTQVRSQLTAADPTAVTLTKTTETVGTANVARLSWTYAYTISTPFIHDTTLNFDSSMIVPLRS